MKLYEIQIPVSPNNELDFGEGITFSNENGGLFKGIFSDSYHKIFFDFVTVKVDGYSVLPKIEGFCRNNVGKIFSEKMIPVRIACTVQEISEIAEFAKKHYKQEAIFCVELGEVTFY